MDSKGNPKEHRTPYPQKWVGNLGKPKGQKTKTRPNPPNRSRPACKLAGCDSGSHGSWSAPRILGGSSEAKGDLLEMACDRFECQGIPEKKTIADLVSFKGIPKTGSFPTPGRSFPTAHQQDGPPVYVYLQLATKGPFRFSG